MPGVFLLKVHIFRASLFNLNKAAQYLSSKFRLVSVDELPPYLEKMISSLATLMSEPLAKKPVRVAN